MHLIALCKAFLMMCLNPNFVMGQFWHTNIFKRGISLAFLVGATQNAKINACKETAQVCLEEDSGPLFKICFRLHSWLSIPPQTNF